MAREKGGPHYVWGICTNLDKDGNGNPCPNCKSKEKIKLSIRDEFVCPECGEPLTKIKGGGSTNWKVIGTIAASVLVLIGLGVGAYFLFFNKKIPTSIKLDKTTLTMTVGESVLINPSVEPKDVKVTYIFKKKGNNIQVTNGGEVTALKKGEATILVKCEENPDIRAICEVEVKEAEDPGNPPVYIKELSIKDGKDFTLAPGATKSLTYIANPEDNDEKPEWESSNPKVVTISEEGVVKAVGEGSATISIKAENVSASVNVTVKGSTPPEGKVNLGYGVYEGPITKSSKAHGIGGQIRFTRSYTIDLKKASGETVDVSSGDRMINVKMDNNRLIQGLLKRSDGSQRWIIIG